MPKLSWVRNWFSFRRLKGWSWSERTIVAALGLTPIVTLYLLGAQATAIAGVFALAWFAALNVVVYRHGGWGLLGPHFYYDVVRLARRGRSTALRVVYIVALFVGLAIVLDNAPVERAWVANDFAAVSQRFSFTLFLIQNIAILILTPAYLGSAIAEERERRTLELLFTTHLSNTEIVLGKLSSRIIHLLGFVLAGFPILSIIQVWGGIDMLLLVGNLANTVLNILSVGSICLLASTLARTVTGAVLTSYAVILPVGFCCAVPLGGFPLVLHDARLGGGGPTMISVQDLGILCVVHLVIVAGFLSLSIAALREHEPLGSVLPPPPGRLDVAQDSRRAFTPELPPAPSTAIQSAPPRGKIVGAEHEPLVDVPRAYRAVEPENEFSIPYTLPPVSDHALMWKERYVGGPPWFFTPVVLVPALPFLVTGFLVLGFWFVRSLVLTGDEFRQAAEGWSVVLRVLYYLCLAAYTLGVGFRAAASVARERQQQTLDPLLLAPIERREILFAKLLGALWRGWPWLGLIAVNIVMGTLMGAYHPVSAILLATAPWPLILFIAALGLFLSVHVGTVMRANLVTLIVVIGLVALSFVLPYGAGPLTYLDPLAFSLWQDPMRRMDRIVGGPVIPVIHVLIGSGPIFAIYSACALVLLKAALVRFEKRVE